jgi:hypothetical protein
MKTLRRILAFLVASLAWFLFAPICFGIETGSSTQEAVGMEAIVPLILSPIVSLAILLLILPTGNRSDLLSCIKIQTIICILGILAVSFLFMIGGIGGQGGDGALDYFFSEIGGILVGFAVAYFCIPLKVSRGLKNQP